MGMYGNLEISGGTSSGSGAGTTVGNQLGVPRVIADGATLTLPDTISLVVADYFSIEGSGSLVLQGDAALMVL